MDPNQLQGQLARPEMPSPIQGGMPQPPMMPPPSSIPTPEMPPMRPAIPEESIPSQPLPEWNRPMNTGSKSDGHKKALLQKLMTNLLSKPGRSMHEVINGVKEAMGAYKNYAKEWDNLGGGVSEPVSSSGNEGGIQKILREVQEKKSSKDGSGGPGMTRMPSSLPPAPSMVPQQMGNVPQPNNVMSPIPPIAGQPQQSSFNRPAPVSSLGIYGF